MERSTAEIVVKVYAVLAWIGAALSALAGLGLIFGGSLLATLGGGLLGMGVIDGVAGGIVGAIGLVVGIVLLGLAAFEVVVGLALWRRENWARIVMIVLSVLNLASFPIGTLVGAFGIYAFGFDETVKGLFSGSVSFKAAASSAKGVAASVKKATKKRK